MKHDVCIQKYTYSFTLTFNLLLCTLHPIACDPINKFKKYTAMNKAISPAIKALTLEMESVRSMANCRHFDFEFSIRFQGFRSIQLLDQRHKYFTLFEFKNIFKHKLKKYLICILFLFKRRESHLFNLSLAIEKYDCKNGSNNHNNAISSDF